jgi:hypothetical protein
METWTTIQNLWEARPRVFVLLALGVVLVIYLTVDAWRLKRKCRPRE